MEKEERQWINEKKKIIKQTCGRSFPATMVGDASLSLSALQHTSIPRSPVFGTERERGVAKRAIRRQVYAALIYR